MTLEYRFDVQFLRAVAILSVVASHVPGSVLTGGYVGVDVFFVISGYLITGLLLTEYQSRNQLDLWRFFAARVRRLLPALLAMIFVVIFLVNALLGAAYLESQYSSIIAASLWASNIFFLLHNVNYFGSGIEDSLMLHTWSLSVEEQFYFVWPFLLLFALQNLHSRGSIDFRLKLIFTSLMLVSLLSYFVITRSNAMHAFLGTPFRVWEFALGGLAFLHSRAGYSERPKSPLRSHLVAPHIGILAIFLGVVLASLNDAGSPEMLLLPTFGTYLVLANKRGHLSSLETNLFSQYLGRISYSWYLCHWPILVMFDSLGLDEVRHHLQALVIGLGIAILITHLVEHPFKRIQILNPRKFLLSGILILSLIVLAMSLHRQHIERISKSEQFEFLNSARVDLPFIYSQGCDDWFHSSQLKPCRYRMKDQSPRVLLISDSNGAQWFSPLHSIFVLERKWDLTVLTKSACSIPTVEYFYPRINRVYSECDDWRQRVFDYISTSDYDLIIIGSLNYAETDSEQKAGVEDLVDRISGATDKLVFLAAAPVLSFDGIICLADKIDSEDLTAQCSERLNSDLYQSRSKVLRDQANERQDVFIIDTDVLVCPEGICRSFDGSNVVFRDSQHLTDSFVRSRIEPLRKEFERILSPLEAP